VPHEYEIYRVGSRDNKTMKQYIKPKVISDLRPGFVCLFAWGLTALSAQIGYIAP